MLRQLVNARKIEQRKAALAEIATEMTTIEQREANVEVALEQAVTEEEMQVVDDEIDAIEKSKGELTEKKSKLEGEITVLEQEIEQLNSKAPSNVEPEARSKKIEKREGGTQMRINGLFRDMTYEERTALVARSEVKDFLAQVRELGPKTQNRSVSGAELTFPEVMLELVRDNLHRYSKLISKVKVKPIKGNARQNTAGTIPEGIWTEACGKLNELNLVFNQIELDGFKVGGFMAVCNSTLEDSDINLAAEILDAIAQAIGLAVDKAIVYGTGKKMPLGIATRLAQTAKPSDWSEKAPAWTDLHTSNVQKFANTGLSSEAFFAALILKLAIARPNYATGGTFWVMNRTTRMFIMSKMIAFNAAGALVAGLNYTMPVEGGEIIELDFMADYDIVGGYGSVYSLGERAGITLAQSEHVQFIEDNTVFKGTARYDGKPVFGESFVHININNATPTASVAFSPDTANPSDAYLKELKIGALALSPVFDGATSSYTVATSNASNAVSAIAAVSKATVVIKVNTVVIESGASPTWEAGANTVEVVVTNGTTTKTYTVIVTKS
jgi:HK97 family phage major capsid protein